MEKHRKSASVDEVWSTFSTATPQLSQNYDKAIDKMIPILQNMLADTNPTSYKNDKPNFKVYRNHGPVRKAPPPPLSHLQAEKSRSSSDLHSEAKTPPVPPIRSIHSLANQPPIQKRADSQPNLLETHPAKQTKRRRPPPPPIQLTDKPNVPPRTSKHVDDDYEIYVIPNNPQPHLLKSKNSSPKFVNTQHTPTSNLVSRNSNEGDMYLSIISPQSDLQPQDDSDEEYMTMRSHHPIQMVDEREEDYDYVNMTSLHRPIQIDNEKEEDYVNMIPSQPKIQRDAGNKRKVGTTRLQHSQVHLPTSSNSLTTQVNNTPGVNGRMETRQLPPLSTKPESYTSMYVDLDSFIQPKKAVHQYIDLDLLSSPDEEYVEIVLPHQKQAFTSPPLPPRSDSFITQDDSIYATIPDI